MPPRDTLLKWKDSLQRENNAGQECVIQGPFGAYSTESIDTLLRLHKANAIKTEVTKELAWFKSSTPTPGMVAEHPSPTSIAKFKTLINSTQYDQYIPGFGMDPDELSRICCNRWLSCDHILWVVQKLNSMQSSTMCCYLNYAGNVKRFVTRRLPVGTPKPSSLLFILNVGKSSNGSVYMGDNVQQGNHWSICYLDKSKKTVTYADSLAYNVPANLRQKVLEFHREIYGEEMGGFTYTKCHDCIYKYTMYIFIYCRFTEKACCSSKERSSACNFTIWHWKGLRLIQNALGLDLRGTRDYFSHEAWTMLEKLSKWM